jgi:hypothetical protein
MKNLIALLLITICIGQAIAQEFEVPKIEEFKSEDDFARFEKDIIACANWLEATPLNQEKEKRTAANAFMIKWVSGSSTVTIGIDEVVGKLADKNEELLVLFIGGWTRYVLQNNYSKDGKKGYLEGLKSVIAVYKKGVAIKEDKDVEKMVKLFDAGELEEWVNKHVK